MADEEKEKAEKLAAAKKRFEQLKKEQQKKVKKTGAKKKEDKPADAKTEDVAPGEESNEAVAPVEDVEQTGDGVVDESTRPEHTRKMSISIQSKQRSESFRQGSTPMSPGAEVQDLYHKQAARIEELELESKTYNQQREEDASRLAKAEAELNGLRETSSSVAELKGKAQEAERLQVDLASAQRQLAQAQQVAKTNQRRTSGTAPDLAEQLASKTSTIESLEMEISNLRNQLNGHQTSISERDTANKDLQDSTTAAESGMESLRQELDALKVSMTFPSDETKAANEDPEALTKRITILESDLRTANTNADAAAKRATNLEQKIEALTKLHRDANTTSQSKDRELGELRSQLKRRDRPSHVRDASEFELGEEETEAGALQTRLRALEAENFDLKRGIWRDKRAELQPGMDHDDGGPSPEYYEDVDLNGPYNSSYANRPTPGRSQHSTFQDVITSGISAFTGRARESVTGSATSAATRPRQSTLHDRKQSVGLLSEDGEDEFDPEAFRLAQEEEGRRRIERVKEIKRGLEDWRGWRVDISEMRRTWGIGSGRDAGAVFEV